MPGLTPKVKETLDYLAGLESGRALTLTANGETYQLFYKGEQVADLTLTDLKTISGNAMKNNNIVQLVDISHLIYKGQVRETDAYIKIEDDIARAFLHLISKIKFVKNPVVPIPKAEVAV